MISYVGNGPYCYANSAAMLLESAGESVEPRVIEVLSGVGLGAFWVAESQTLFLSGLASAPDVGLSRSFGLLGFDVDEEAELDGDAIPIDALNLQLGKGPVLLGPLDMGELSYFPNARGANGADHFVLALRIEDGAVVVHDPAGYPAMPIGVEALDRAWRADLIAYRRGHIPYGGTPPLASKGLGRCGPPKLRWSPSVVPIGNREPFAIRVPSSAQRRSRRWQRPSRAESYVILDWNTCGDLHCLWVCGALWTIPGTSAASIQSWPTSRAGKHGSLPVLTPQRPNATGNPSQITSCT